MQFKNSNFTAEMGQIYVVTTSLLGTVTITAPTVGSGDADSGFICINNGLGTLAFTKGGGVTFNGSATGNYTQQWGAYYWLTDGNDWYKSN